MNLYRVHYGWTTGGASSSEIEYYEKVESLKRDLLEHHLDILAGNHKNWLSFVLADAWRRFLGRAENTRRTTRIYKVEKVVNDEWVPVEYKFIEPEVLLD